jgi:hypothetical protein
LHHGFGSLHTWQFVGGLFARFAGISLGPKPQDTRQQDTKQQHHKTGHRKKSKQPTKKIKMDSPLELSIGFKFVEFFFFWERRVKYSGLAKRKLPAQ